MCHPDEQQRDPGQTAQPNGAPRDGGRLDIPLAQPVAPPESLAAAGSQCHRLSHPMLLANMSGERAAVNLAVFFAVVVAYSAGASFLGGLFDRPETAQDPQWISLVVTIAGGGLFFLLAAMLMQGASGWRAALGLGHVVRGVDVLLGLVVMVSVFAAFFAVVGLIWLTWPNGYAQMQENPKRIGEMIPRMPPLWLLVLSVWVGIYEEVVFRGFLLTHVRRLTRSWPAAIVITSAVFALLHGSSQVLAMCFPLFGLGVVFAVFTVWRKSLVPAIVGHALFNFVQLYYLFYLNPARS